MSTCEASKETINSELKRAFGDAIFITFAQFRTFLNISRATEWKMRQQGQFPRIIHLPGRARDGRIMIADLAAWLEGGGCPEAADDEKRPSNQ